MRGGSLNYQTMLEPPKTEHAAYIGLVLANLPGGSLLEALPSVGQRRCADLTGDSIESSPIGRLAKPLQLDGRLYWELSD